MVYYIDGHNLIPKIQGMSLRQIDDEEQLLELLSEFARLRRRSLEVFFDQAPAGHSGTGRHGMIKVHYVTQRTIADEAIIRQVLRAGRRAVEIVVVSSDRHVIQQVRSAGALSVTAEQFSREIRQTFDQAASTGEVIQEPTLSESELEEWLRLFGQ